MTLRPTYVPGHRSLVHHQSHHCHVHPTHISPIVRPYMIGFHSQKYTFPALRPHPISQFRSQSCTQTRCSFPTRGGSAGHLQRPCNETLKRFNPHLASLPSLRAVFALLPMSAVYCSCMGRHCFCTFCVIRAEPNNFLTWSNLPSPRSEVIDS